MAMDPKQRDAELRRKALAGKPPTDPANMTRYNEIKSTLGQPKQETSPFKGLFQGIGDVIKNAYDNYVTTKRTKAANQLAPSSRIDRIDDELGNIRNQLMQPQDPFRYDPKDDPQYKAALRQAQANSQTAAGDIAADMNKRGLLNSTITQDRGDQAAQREYGRVSDTTLPQLMQQAYNRYITEQTNRRQGLLDQVDLLGTEYDIVTGERDYSDTQRAAEAETKRADRDANWGAYLDIVDRSGNFRDGPKSDWGLLIQGANSGAPTIDAQKFQEDIRQFGIDTALKQAGLEQDAQQFAANQGLQWAQLNQRDKEFIADQVWKQKNYELDVAQEERLSQPPQSGGLDPVRERAVELATQDLNFPNLTPEKQKERIDFYINLLGGSTQNAPITDDELLEYLK